MNDVLVDSTLVLVGTGRPDGRLILVSSIVQSTNVNPSISTVELIASTEPPSCNDHAFDLVCSAAFTSYNPIARYSTGPYSYSFQPTTIDLLQRWPRTRTRKTTVRPR
ncbi:hypothetical protein Adt_14104 [Abeliophyllum distichum]|uniref:Uncharacterized protein n=1 Tax=Abeliophyllum distichum TaxID=126358 RepID=A0ABD1TYP7_9LAMI